MLKEHPDGEHSVNPDVKSESSTQSALQVVAIGASAGGLDALEKLFAGLPKDPGAAFVVIQHLSPDHKSMMADLLARRTPMQVVMVEDEMALEPNQVFLIPPGAMMHIEGSHLRLTPKGPRSMTLPIDVFFQSLAKQHGDRTVGIILSGTGSDGSRGLLAINEAGGLLMVQDPEDAKFDGMPRSAIATGLVDEVLPIDAMPARIMAHLSRTTAERTAVAEAARAPMTEDAVLALHPDAALAGILQLLHQLSGVDFRDYNPGTGLRRSERRMSVRQVHSIQAYLELLNQDRNEVQTLRHEMLIPVTSFFRDTDAYTQLVSQVIEPIVANREAGEPIRVWCAGVATGEEPYSIAMLFLETFDQIKRWPSLKVFATDVDQINVETAAAGNYPESIVAEISSERLERFFQRSGNRFVVKNELRQCLVFARHNLLSDPPFTRMDLVVCRNTLIYFRSEAQINVLRRLQYALRPKAFLFLGSSESLGDVGKDFRVVSTRHKLWQMQRQGASLLDLNRQAPVIGRARHAPASTGVPLTRTRRLSNDAVDLGYDALLKSYGPPPAVLVNAAQELVHAYGDISPFLSIREGQLSLELNRILLEPLVPVAAALLFKCGREGTSVSSDVVRLAMPRTADDTAEGAVAERKEFVRLCALPAGDVDGQRQSLLVFERLDIKERGDHPMSMDISSETAERIEALEHELAVTRESLQATIEELETSNEELQSTNEEMMSSNEELQSSNEELQSVNEELNTVNAEFQEKIDILNRINADLDNLTKVVASCTLFVDDELTMVRYSPEAAGIFRLREGDLGRPLEDLNHLLDYPGLMDDLRATLDAGIQLEKAVAGLNGRHFMVRMQPYHIPSAAARGVVIHFVDVTPLHEAQARLQDVLDALAENIAVLDQGGNIVMINRAWEAFARNNCDPALVHSGTGQNYLEVCQVACETEGADSDAARACQGLRRVLAGEQANFSMEYPCHAPDQQRWFVMHATRLGAPHPGVVVSHVELTDGRQKRAQAQEQMS